MKRIIAIIALAMLSLTAIYAKGHEKYEQRCLKADDIVCRVFIQDKTGDSYAVFFKASDGTYRCQCVDGKPEYDKDGKLVYDTLNPEPELRKIPVHKAIIISGLKYNASKKQWDGGKIHNPGNKLETANCTVDFVDGGKTIRVFGNLMGIGKNVYWKVVE